MKWLKSWILIFFNALKEGRKEIIVGCVTAIILAIGSFYYERISSIWNVIIPQPTCAEQAADSLIFEEDRFNAIVFGFEGDSQGQAHLATVRSLHQYFEKYLPIFSVHSVKVDDRLCVLSSLGNERSASLRTRHEQAIKLLQNSGADIAVWGETTPQFTGIDVQFSGKFGSSLSSEMSSGAPSKLRLPAEFSDQLYSAVVLELVRRSCWSCASSVDWTLRDLITATQKHEKALLSLRSEDRLTSRQLSAFSQVVSNFRYLLWQRRGVPEDLNAAINFLNFDPAHSPVSEENVDLALDYSVFYMDLYKLTRNIEALNYSIGALEELFDLANRLEISEAGFIGTLNLHRALVLRALHKNSIKDLERASSLLSDVMLKYDLSTRGRQMIAMNQLIEMFALKQFGKLIEVSEIIEAEKVVTADGIQHIGEADLGLIRFLLAVSHFNNGIAKEMDQLEFEKADRILSSMSYSNRNRHLGIEELTLLQFKALMKGIKAALVGDEFELIRIKRKINYLPAQFKKINASEYYINELKLSLLILDALYLFTMLDHSKTDLGESVIPKKLIASVRAGKSAIKNAMNALNFESLTDDQKFMLLEIRILTLTIFDYAEQKNENFGDVRASMDYMLDTKDIKSELINIERFSGLYELVMKYYIAMNKESDYGNHMIIIGLRAIQKLESVDGGPIVQEKIMEVIERTFEVVERPDFIYRKP